MEFIEFRKVTLLNKEYITLADYRALPESKQRTELINGELIVSPSPKYTHQQIVFETAKVIDESEGRTIISPMDLYLDEVTVLEPDIFYLADDNAVCQLRDDDYWYGGAPDLVVEVLLPSTAVRNRGVQYNLYQNNGVAEYWIIDPYMLSLEVYVLMDDVYKRQGVHGGEDTFKSPALNREIACNRLFGGW